VGPPAHGPDAGLTSVATRPPAEVDVTTDLVRTLLRQQHPDLADLSLRPASSGWDNVTLRLGDRLAVRVPRRLNAAGLVENEQVWLPVLAPRLGVDVPVPVRVGRPSADFPWAWSVVPWFTGRPATSMPPARRRRLAVPLADVVARLHVPAPDDAPVNPVRGVPLARRDSAVQERLASGAVPEPDRVRRVWQHALAAPPWPGPPLWIHGDLHPANLIVGEQGDLRAVLDFGDVAAGDPATDLAAAWLAFEAGGRRRFRDRLAGHSGADADTWVRARGWALVMATAVLVHSDDDPVFARLAREGLAQVLAD
jgi:aminoglycoside phosphotransferase (APT) family kinase protein